MIITPIEEKDAWTCLARRGMLLSETESIEFWQFESGDGIEFGVDHGVDELIVVLAGSVEVADRLLHAGMIALVPEGMKADLKARESARVLSVRTVPDRLTALMPPRVPELPMHERAI